MPLEPAAPLVSLDVSGDSSVGTVLKTARLLFFFCLIILILFLHLCDSSFSFCEKRKSKKGSRKEKKGEQDGGGKKWKNGG